jgi:hypothetical protein
MGWSTMSQVQRQEEPIVKTKMAVVFTYITVSLVTAQLGKAVISQR